MCVCSLTYRNALLQLIAERRRVGKTLMKAMAGRGKNSIEVDCN